MGAHDPITVPMEWVFKGNRNGGETAIIRRFLFGYPHQEWFRVVTYSPSSAERELIGWCKTMEAAQTVAWDYSNALDTWRHREAAHRGEYTAPPPAAELLRAYREALQARGGQ